MENIRLAKVVYNKEQFEKTINTSFTQLTSSITFNTTASNIDTINDPVNIQAQIDKFFLDYNNLFFNIPKFGNIKSHEYLIKTSVEYIGTTFNDDEITALTAEIDSLRTELISLNEINLKLLNKN
jgi:hypothetical protein